MKIVEIVIIIYGLYFITTALFAFKKNKKQNNIVKENHFSILIPARNEEKVIKNLIKSLKNQEYTNYSINIILNNCTDNTYNICKNEKVNIINCETNIKSKGDALKEAFNKLKNSKTDAYIVFDADNVVDKYFLKYMNISINNGYEVAQGFRDIKNKNNNWLSISYSFYYYIQNFFFNKSRKNLNKSSSINGTGFMIKKDVIDRIGFNVVSLTEDIELSGLCAINDIKIDYVEEAITYDEQPNNLKVSFIQRTRWLKGANQCFKKYYKVLLKKHTSQALDNLFIYMFPYFIIILLILLFNKNILYILLIALILTYTICTFLMLYYKKSIKNNLKGIIMFPIFLITWVPIDIYALLKKDVEWKQIKHIENVDIEEI